MGFQRFDQFGRSFSPKITIRSNGQIGFATGAVEKFGIRGFDFCALYYDPESKKIGIRLSAEEETGATVRIAKREQNFFIPAKPFLDFFDVDYSVSRVYNASYDEEGSMIVLNLDGPARIRQRKRKKSI